MAAVSAIGMISATHDEGDVVSDRDEGAAVVSDRDEGAAVVVIKGRAAMPPSASFNHGGKRS